MWLTMNEYQNLLILIWSQPFGVCSLFYGLLRGMPITTSHAQYLHLGKSLLHMNAIDGSGEYLVFSGTEEWSRLLISLGEAPPE
jgi:hypothetical protein